MATIVAIYRRTITAWLWNYPGMGIKSTLYYQIGTIEYYLHKLEGEIAKFIIDHTRLWEGLESLTFIIDDTLTKRFGKNVERANYHHNPTPSKTNAKLFYGHSWVVLAILSSINHGVEFQFRFGAFSTFDNVTSKNCLRNSKRNILLEQKRPWPPNSFSGQVLNLSV